MATMSLEPAQWHARYTQQARWTQDLRRYLYDLVDLPGAQRILDIGCGTGALIPELAQLSQAVYGIDIQPQNVGYAKKEGLPAHFLLGDALELPFTSHIFDVTLCHFVLLWVRNPSRLLGEMVRVTRSGGAVLALAEPDYGGRIDYPPELAILGEWQQASLRQQGADPCLGRKLGQLFFDAGLTSIEVGVLGGQWKGSMTQDEIESEWKVIDNDLVDLFPPQQLASLRTQLARLKQVDQVACQKGDRILYVPTFYAMGIAL
jgi:SAM-dependent methyltransferase